MRKPTRKGTIIGTAVAGGVVALGLGGVAYAAGNDPATPEQGYVVVEDGPGTTATTPGQEGQSTDGRDCPDKQGQADGQGDGQETPSQTDPQGQA
jgi:hypothetical protein